MSINAAGAVAAPKTGDEIYKDVLKWAQVGISSLSVIVYAVERGIRYGQIPTELSGVDPALNVGGPVERFTNKISLAVQLIKALSYGITAMAFFDKIFEYADTTKEEVVFLGITLTKGRRRTALYVVIAAAGIPMGILYYIKLHEAVSSAAKRWEKPISLITNLGKCFYGIYQLIFLIKNPEIFKDRKLFIGCNIAKNITAVVEVWGLDVVFYTADLGVGAGIGYIAVYSFRTALQTAEVVGLAIAD